MAEEEIISNKLKALKARRGQLRASVTRFSNHLANPINFENIAEIKIRLERCDRNFFEFDTVQSELECLDNKESNQREDLENSFYEVIAKAKSIIESKSPLVSPTRAALNIASSVNNIKLQPIELPSFSGGYEKWYNFKDIFTSLIHNNVSLDPVQKFHYLRSCLRDEAASVLDSLEVNNNNYAIAWNVLEERYENKRLIVHNYVKALFDINLIQKESQEALRNVIDTVSKNIRALNVLGQPTDNWDTLIIFLITSKLDGITKREWESTLTANHFPTLKQLIDFLKKRCLLLEALDTPKSNNFQSSQFKYRFQQNKPISKANLSYGSSENSDNNRAPNFACYYCKQSHVIYKCSAFINLSLDEKYRELRKLNLCLNCLRPGHVTQDCQSGGCHKCNFKHNTLLHPRNPVPNPQNNMIHQCSDMNMNEGSDQGNHSSETGAYTNLTSISTHSSLDDCLVLLSTAIVYIKDKFGHFHLCRALLDSGSQSNFITTSLVKKLQLTESDVNLSISCVGRDTKHIFKKSIATIKSTHGSFQHDLSFLILPQITENIPSLQFKTTSINIPNNVQLADPKFNIPGEIDILIGASIFYDLFLGENISLDNGTSSLRKTKLGWIVSGSIKISEGQKQIKSQCHFSLNQQLTRFWELEEVQFKKHLSLDEQYCEAYFKETTTRDIDGRFIVKLPCNESINNLGNSSTTALKRLESVERKFCKDAEYKKLYIDFLREYRDMNHMTLISNESNNDDCSFYLPHHGVRKEESSTTKLRVVFDGSAITNSGVSLNNCLRVGPTIQDDLFDIVLRFRTHSIVFTADIAKMYRMILVHPDDQKFQRIFWRESESEPIKIFTLNTVTYGTAPASFLAIRCLHELAYENKSKYPEASSIVLRDFFVDDLMTGADTLEHALKIKREIDFMLKSGGFELRKWSSNSETFINELGKDSFHIFQEKGEIKTLGLIWCPKNDHLQYSVNIDSFNKHITKRQILSFISKIFDPLGLLGGALIKAKIMMQRLWQCRINWDDPIPQELVASWHDFVSKIQNLNRIKIPRHVIIPCSKYIELHGFSDSSEAAYGCCVYLRSKINDNEILTRLLCSKSRVAPLKKVSLPRLELCGALLLAKLVKRVTDALSINVNKTVLWTDSKIVLAWITTQPCYLQTFVANRVAEIVELTSIADWYHVKSEQNPADIVSRGIDPDHLASNKLWWYGPGFLKGDYSSLLKNNINTSDIKIPDMKNTSISLTVGIKPDYSIVERFSSLKKLKRVVAYILRFKNNCLSKYCKDSKISSKHILTVDELFYAMNCLIRLAQAQEFSNEIGCLVENKSLFSTSKLLNLHPFIDKEGIIRVGGRLKNSNLSYEQKHPIILPSKHILTKLIILDKHLTHLHAGTQSLLSIIRLEFWPLSGRASVKRVLRSCVKCFRANPKPLEQLMGNVPSDRFSVCRPFYKCAVDYAGPFFIKNGVLRKSKIVKAYICLFVCLTTKAVHIELVHDLSTDAFLNSLKRFISRRGRPSDIYSDNGKNFVGAANSLTELYDLLCSENHNNKVANFLSCDKIAWHFIPARSPHMGGLWEAAVKSAKYHLKRIISEAYLTFEEMYTLLVQIEACLNSRPLTPISVDPLDFSALTPAHFIIGDSLFALPQANLTEVKESRLSHYQRLQQMLQHFWKRWSLEYLSSLQVRSKWKIIKPNTLEPGMLVLIKEDNTAPLKWPLARIVTLHPGMDKLVRVVSVKFPGGSIVKRPITKICILPIEQ